MRMRLAVDVGFIDHWMRGLVGLCGETVYLAGTLR